MQQNEIYNIPLPRGPGPENKTKKRQQKWDKLPRWINTSNSSRGHKISTRDGSEIDSDLTYRFLKYWIALRKVCSFRKTKQKWPPPSTARARPLYPRYISAFLRCQPHPLVPSLAASTSHLARSRGGTGNLNLNFKLGHYMVSGNIFNRPVS
jgi:hypothetical protein